MIMNQHQAALVIMESREAALVIMKPQTTAQMIMEPHWPAQMITVERPQPTMRPFFRQAIDSRGLTRLGISRGAQPFFRAWPGLGRSA